MYGRVNVLNVFVNKTSLMTELLLDGVLNKYILFYVMHYNDTQTNVKIRNMIFQWKDQ
jgi:hypothetical protein